MDNVFYTYLWLREDGTPYYVGKGYLHRAFERHRIGKAPTKERIILQQWLCEEDAFAAEKFLITYYGRKDNGTGILRNFTDGGEGTSGSMALRGRRCNPAGEIKKGMHLSSATEFKKGHLSWTGCFGPASPRFGKPHSEDAKRRIALANKGKPHPKTSEAAKLKRAQDTRNWWATASPEARRNRLRGWARSTWRRTEKDT